MSSGRLLGACSYSPPPIRLIASTSFAPSSTAVFIGVLSTTPPSRCSRSLMRTEGNTPGMAVEEGRDSGQRHGPIDEPANVLLRHHAELVAAQPRDNDAEGVGLEDGRRLARKPDLAQHHRPGQRGIR